MELARLRRPFIQRRMIRKAASIEVSTHCKYSLCKCQMLLIGENAMQKRRLEVYTSLENTRGMQQKWE